jgi:hypothetical protein
MTRNIHLRDPPPTAASATSYYRTLWHAIAGQRASFSEARCCSSQLVCHSGYLEDRRIFIDLEYESFPEPWEPLHGIVLESGIRLALESGLENAFATVSCTANG